MKFNKKIGLGLLALFVSVAAEAHHSSAPHFDTTKELSLNDAVVVDWKFVNPHSYIYFDVSADNGELAHWRCEMSAATLLGRAGWTQESLQPGQHINITGSPARREANSCVMKTIFFADGSEIAPTEGLLENGAVVADQKGVVQSQQLNGRPDFNGDWITLSFGPGSRGGEPAPQFQGAPTWGGYELTESGLALAEAYDVRFDDPALGCGPINIIEGWNHDINVNHITQTADKLILQYGYVDYVRTIHMDIDKHPENMKPSIGGHSIGRWADKVLVVDTVGFEPGLLLHQGGVHHSDQMHIVERFYLDNKTKELVRNYQITDPVNFVGVRQGVDYMARSAAPYTPYNCVELAGKNNERPE